MQSPVSSAARLRLFGTPLLSDADGVPIGGGVVEPHRIALLALLALHPRRTVARADLARFLWPGRDAEQARQLLNQALFGISKALGDDAIFPSAKEVRLGARVSVDALDFQSALEAGRPEDAMQLFTAPLMDDFELDDAPEFQRWAAKQRERFETARKTLRPVAEPADGFVLAEPELQAPVEPADAPKARASLPAEPATTAFPPQPDLVTNAIPAAAEPPSVVDWTELEPPDTRGASTEPPADIDPAAEESQDDVIRDEPPEPPAPAAPPAPDVAGHKVTATKRRRRRAIPFPPARQIVTVLVLIVLAGAAYMAGDRILKSRAKARSIAVLPIEFIGRNPADAALAARVTEELGPMLTRSGLIVAPTATLARSRPPYDVRRIADTLGVAHVLQGVMRKDGARVEFRFQLVNAVDSVLRWEQTYRPKLEDIPVLQDDVAATVAQEILRPRRP